MQAFSCEVRGLSRSWNGNCAGSGTARAAAAPCWRSSGCRCRRSGSLPACDADGAGKGGLAVIMIVSIAICGWYGAAAMACCCTSSRCRRIADSCSRIGCCSGRPCAKCLNSSVALRPGSVRFHGERVVNQRIAAGDEQITALLAALAGLAMNGSGTGIVRILRPACRR